MVDQTAAPSTSAIPAAVIYCFLLVGCFGCHESDSPKPPPYGVLDIFDGICESNLGQLKDGQVVPF